MSSCLVQHTILAVALQSRVAALFDPQPDVFPSSWPLDVNAEQFFQNVVPNMYNVYFEGQAKKAGERLKEYENRC